MKNSNRMSNCITGRLDRMRDADSGQAASFVLSIDGLPRRTASEISRFPVDAHLSPIDQRTILGQIATFRQLRET
jgi:hypothetical protein